VESVPWEGAASHHLEGQVGAEPQHASVVAGDAPGDLLVERSPLGVIASAAAARLLGLEQLHVAR